MSTSEPIQEARERFTGALAGPFEPARGKERPFHVGGLHLPLDVPHRPFGEDSSSHELNAEEDGFSIGVVAVLT